MCNIIKILTLPKQHYDELVSTLDQATIDPPEDQNNNNAATTTTPSLRLPQEIRDVILAQLFDACMNDVDKECRKGLFSLSQISHSFIRDYYINPLYARYQALAAAEELYQKDNCRRLGPIKVTYAAKWADYRQLCYIFKDGVTSRQKLGEPKDVLITEAVMRLERRKLFIEI